MTETAAVSPDSYPRCGNRYPTIRVAERYEDTLEPDAYAIARYCGINLLDWQRDVLRDFLAISDNGKWAHDRCCLSVSRQNGKSYLVIAMCLYLLIVKRFKIAYTAQNYATVLDIFDRFKRIFGTRAKDPFAPYPELNDMVLRVRGTASREGIDLKHVEDGGIGYDPCISFSTRTDSSLRGQSYDVLIIDECQLCSSSQFASIGPVTKSGPAGNSMRVFIGTPETPFSKGEIFGNIRKGALNGADSDKTCWIEWSVDEVGDVKDPARWYETNPSLGILGDESEIRSSAGTMNPFDFAQEYLGFWPKQSVESVINVDKWVECATENPPADGIVSYAVKFSPDGSRGVLSVCLKPTDGKPHIEVIESRSMGHGITWFADWLEARKTKAAQITVDGMANAQPLVDELLRRGVPRSAVVKPRSGDVSAACSELLNAVNECAVTHYDQQALNESATKSKRRNIGGGGGWGFADNGCDSTLVESCALALWGANHTKRNPNRKQRIGF